MSIVKNEAKYKNPLLKAIREQLEHRAYWLYLLCDEAGKRGLDWREFGEPAIRRCGLDHGAKHVKKGNTDSLKGLISLDFDKPLKGFDMSAYAAYPIHGSLALTQRGQTVLELLDYQGIT